MKYLELSYSSFGSLMGGNYNGKFADLNQISQIIFDIIQESETPPKFFRFHTPQNYSSPETIKNFLANFSETYLRDLREILIYKGVNLIVKGDSYKYNLRENQMDKETLRMQMLAGVITESEYAAAISQEIENTEKDSLNESMIGGIVGIGAITQIPSREKTDYEMAFEHFLGERYQLKPNRERDDIKDINEEEVEENIHNTAQMGGILGGRNFSAEAEEDEKAAFEIEDLIQSGVSKEEAIQKVSDKYRLQPSYLSRKYNLYVLKEEEVEEDLNESALAIAGGVILGVLGLKPILRIIKGISSAVSLAKMTDPKELKKAVAEIGREAMQKGKNPLQIALWMSTVNSMIENGEIKNGLSLGRTWGNIDKIDLERVFSSSESGEVEEGKEVEEPNNY